MRIKDCLPALSIALSACAQLSPHSTGTTSPDSVVAQIARQFSACNLDDLMAAYGDTIEYVSPSTPRPIAGRAALREHFSGACRSQVRAIMRVETQRVHMLTPDSAVVTGTYSFGRTDRPNDKPWPAFFVITVKQSEGRWIIGTQATFAIPEN